MKNLYLKTILFLYVTNVFILTAKSIKKEAINNIRIVYDSSQVIIPGRNIKLGIDIFMEGGQKRSTRGLAKGNVGWRHFNVTCDGGQFSMGNLYIPYNDFTIHKGEIYLYMSMKKKPDIKTVKVIHLNYETKVKIFQANDFLKSPGEMVKYRIVSYFNNGQSLEASSFPQSQLSFNHYIIETTGGTFKNGNFFIENNVDRIDNHYVGIRVIPRTNPNISEENGFLLDYKKSFLFIDNAISGFNGNNGWSGSHGNDGKNGEYGENGCDGEPGDDGHDIEIFVDCYYDTLLNDKLLQIFTKNLQTGFSKKYYVSTTGGDIQIISRGGDGGRGGEGGSGGHGGEGRDEYHEVVKKRINDSTIVEIVNIYPAERGGHGGDGGNGGFGGDGGFGGNINIYFTKKAEPYLKWITASSIPGKGGEGGRGGNGGSPGKGGKGNPEGKNGRPGRNGESGGYGYNGQPGIVEYYLMDEIAW